MHVLLQPTWLFRGLDKAQRDTSLQMCREVVQVACEIEIPR